MEELNNPPLAFDKWIDGYSTIGADPRQSRGTRARLLWMQNRVHRSFAIIDYRSHLAAGVIRRGEPQVVDIDIRLIPGTGELREKI